jgi:hypothetical protein
MLAGYLSSMTPAVQAEQVARFAGVTANLEFGLCVPMQTADAVTAEAMRRGFTVCGHADGTYVFLYGAGMVVGQTQFTDVWTWLRQSCAAGGKSQVGIHASDQPIRLIDLAPPSVQPQQAAQPAAVPPSPAVPPPYVPLVAAVVDARPTAWTKGGHNMGPPSGPVLVVAGAVAWIAWVGLILVAISTMSMPLEFAAIGAVIIPLQAAVNGSELRDRLHSGTGTVLVIGLCAMTLIGLPWVAYWTGKGLAKWFGYV